MHDHAHYGGHSHGGHGHGGAHSHGLSGPLSLVLGLALLANLLLVIVEFVAGYMGHSIALISDGVHNLTDVPTLALSWFAARLATRPPTPEKTYGYHRAGILSAFVNALLLSLVAFFIVYESYLRLRHPVAVQSALMLWVALIALVVNGGITIALVGRPARPEPARHPAAFFR
jgi:cobalt-zinc-cadmium efflux system protein